MTGSEPVKKRRGRPRKYGPELGLVPGAPSFTQAQTSGGGSGEGGSSTQKRMRGRPRGSSNRKKLQALGNLYLYYMFFCFVCFVLESSSSRDGLDLLCRLQSIRI